MNDESEQSEPQIEIAFELPILCFQFIVHRTDFLYVTVPPSTVTISPFM